MFKHLESFWKSQGIDPDEHIGNMWGWKVSYIGLGVLVFLIALYFYRVNYSPVEPTLSPTFKTEQTLEPRK